MKKITWGVLFIILASFFNKSTAQGIKVLDSNNKPVAEAIVAVKDIFTKKEAIFFTDNSGFAKINQYSNPVILFIKCLGYKDYSDSLKDFSIIQSIHLTKSKIDLNEVVITGEYSPKLISESVNDFTVINKDKIEQQGAVNLKDVFEQQLNVRIERDPVLEGSGLSSRGLNGNNIKFLIDGVPVVGRMNGFIDLSQLNVSNVEKIEVVNGPMSVNYGTDALGGVINIITSKMTNEKIYSGINTYYENTQQYNVDGTIGYRYKSSSLLLNGGRNFFDGWSPVDTSRAKTWKPKEQYFGDAKFTYDYKKWKFLYHLSAFDEKISAKGNPKITPYEAYAFDDYFRTFRLINQLNTDYLISQKNSLNISVARSGCRRIKSRYRKDLVALEQILTGNADQDTTRFTTYNVRSTFNHYSNNEKLNFQTGFDLNADNGSGGRIETQSKTIDDYAVFASMEYSFTNHLQVRPGLRFAYNTLFKAPLIPSVNLKYAFNDNQQLRASYSRGFRAPTLKELYLDFVDVNHDVHGNPELSPESSNNFSLSFSNTIRTKNFIIKIQPIVFYNDINDKITLAQAYIDSSLFTYINIGKYKTTGGQINNELIWKNFNFNLGFAYTGRYNDLPDEFKSPSFSYSPEVSSGFGYTLAKTKTTFSVFMKYNGELPVYYVDNNEVKEFINVSYALMDASIQQKLFHNSLTLGFGIKNITDVEFVKSIQLDSPHGSEDNNMAVGTGRSVFVKAQYNFGR